MRLDESSTMATDACALQLYAEWRRFWEIDKPILVEKSPRHVVMTRLLQHWFTPERSFFIVILRHPLAVNSFLSSPAYNTVMCETCGSVFVQNWLDMYEMLFDDLNYIKNKAVLQYERLGDESRLHGSLHPFFISI